MVSGIDSRRGLHLVRGYRFSLVGMTKKRRSWIRVEACTLPTVEQPMRLAEFEDLFRASLRDVETPGPGVARFRLVGGPDLFGRVRISLIVSRSVARSSTSPSPKE